MATRRLPRTSSSVLISVRSAAGEDQAANSAGWCRSVSEFDRGNARDAEIGFHFDILCRIADDEIDLLVLDRVAAAVAVENLHDEPVLRQGERKMIERAAPAVFRPHDIARGDDADAHRGNIVRHGPDGRRHQAGQGKNERADKTPALTRGAHH